MVVVTSFDFEGLVVAVANIATVVLPILVDIFSTEAVLLFSLDDEKFFLMRFGSNLNISFSFTCALSHDMLDRIARYAMTFPLSG